MLEEVVSAVQKQEEILIGDRYFQSLMEDIQNAVYSIDLETYIFNDDMVGTQFANALASAAARGVRVRVLVDGAGCRGSRKNIVKMEKAGILIRIFHPFPWKLWQWNRANFHSSILYKAIYLLSKLNSRNHRKTCIIDGKIVYVGSANIVLCHSGKENGGDGWRDTSIKLLSPPNIKELQYAFDIAWSGFPIEERVKETFHKVDKNPLFRLNYSRHQRRMLYKYLLRRISTAKNRIWVTSAYFNPDYFLLKRLKKAAKRGVDVKILLACESDIPLMPIVATTFYTLLLEEGANIHEYLPSILHAKISIIDDWYCVGSSNLNYRSIRHDLEVDVNIRTKDAKRELEEQFLKDISQSQQITFDHLLKQPLHKRILGRLLLYIRYFL